MQTVTERNIFMKSVDPILSTFHILKERTKQNKSLAEHGLFADMLFSLRCNTADVVVFPRVYSRSTLLHYITHAMSTK